MSVERRLYWPEEAGRLDSAGARNPEGHRVHQGGPRRQPDELVALDPEEAHYARSVLRLADGAEITMLDGQGGRQAATLVWQGRRGAAVRPLAASPGRGTPPGQPSAWGSAIAMDLTLIVALPKGERADWLVEKACELGVRTVAFGQFDRSSPGQGSEARLTRWRRVARAAGRQAQHGLVTTILPPRPLVAALGEAAPRDGLRLVAHGGPDSRPIGEALNAAAIGSAATVVVGPEGGFTPAELQGLLAAGYGQASLGPTVLRLETAAIVASATCLLAAAQSRHRGPPAP